MKRPLRVLIVEDSSDDTEWLLRELQGHGYRPACSRVSNLEAMSAALDEETWEVVISDYLLSQFSASAALRLLKERGLDLPLIIVTGEVGEEVAVAAMKEGASDYLLKDRLARLGPAVQQALEQKRLRDEKRQTEEALRESERQLRLIVENTADVIMAYDLDRRLIYVNPAVEKQTGYRVDELRHQEFINWVHPQDAPRMMELLEKLYRGQAYSEEFRIVTKDGQVKWCLGSWGPLYDEHGRQIGIQGSERDITERKHAEEALAESENLLRKIIETEPECVKLLAKDGTLLEMNQAGLEMV